MMFAALTAAGPALAQSPPIPVFYTVEKNDANGFLADSLVHQVLARPAFTLHAKRDAGVLVVSRSSSVDREHGSKMTQDFDFTLTFYRDGARLAESEENCLHDAMEACADQVAADIAGADGIGR